MAPVQRLYDEVVVPIATAATPGAWYRAHRVVSVDGTTLEVADTQANAAAFGRPSSSRGVNATGAFPQLRLVALVENGTQVVFGAAMAPYATGEATLARTVLPALRPGLLCLADRYFLGFDLWQQAAATGAALVWRAKANQRFPVEVRYADGSYRSTLRANTHGRSRDHTPIPVRVIEYTLPGVPDAEPSYRVVTTLLDPDTAPAVELAALSHERGEIETACDALKTPLRGARIVLRSKTPDLVRQEAYGLLLAHFAVRGLMHEAALAALPTPRDPDTLSSCTPSASFAARCPAWRPFPPEDQPRALRAIRPNATTSGCTPAGAAASSGVSSGK